MKIATVVGARPNFVKLAALDWEMRRRPGVHSVTVHTGQHHDPRLSESFFDELEISPPDINLGVGSGPPLAQLGAILSGLEPVLLELRPDWVMVVGDVTSTLAAALSASRLGIPLAHVEAGLRSFDPTMPEEVNRRLTDSLSDLLFATEASAVENLAREGIDPARVHLVGNTMIDTLLRFRDRAAASDILERLDLEPGGYGVLTLHRPSTVDRPDRLLPLLEVIGRMADRLPIVFPVHPRTRRKVADGSAPSTGFRFLDPLGYLDFVRLLSEARLVLTDSGGIQEEATILGVPCLTLRTGTERPVTVTHGTNRIVGTEPDRVLQAFHETLDQPRPAPGMPPQWDGSTAMRILDILSAHYPARAGGEASPWNEPA